MRAQRLFWKTASIILDEIAVEPLGYINLFFLCPNGFKMLIIMQKKYAMKQPRLFFSLNHWRQVTHICVSNLSTIGSDNGLLPGQYQAIIHTNAGILLI